MYFITFTSITYIQVDFRRDPGDVVPTPFSRPPNEDPVKIQRQAAREEEARIAKVVEFGVTKTNLFFLGVDQRMQIYGGFKGFACDNVLLWLVGSGSFFWMLIIPYVDFWDIICKSVDPCSSMVLYLEVVTPKLERISPQF